MEIILYRDRRNHPLHVARKALSGDDTQSWLSRALDSGKPFMASRFGNTELQVMVHFHKMKHLGLARRLLDPIETWKWSFNWYKTPLNDLEALSGFFPQSEKLIRRFAELMKEHLSDVDLLGSWAKGEVWFEKSLAHAEVCRLNALEPWHHPKPWTQSLAGRKVLIVHPFEESIKVQYANRRTRLFSNAQVLPEFDLFTIKAVQSVAGNKPAEFTTWFDALDHMTETALASPADVVVIGCGAYGFPLAARLKRAGKQCIHLGGATQLLFGIRGARWETPPHDSFAREFYNEFWVRPSLDERPKNANAVEGACYW